MEECALGAGRMGSELNGSLEGYKAENGRTGLGVNGRREVHKAENGVQDSAAGAGDEKQGTPNFQYFCQPNQNKNLDAWKIFIFHMLPFTTVPHVVILVLLTWCYHRWGGLVFAYFFSIMLVLSLSPRVYSRSYRAAVRDHFYLLLARYVPSAQYVVPEKPFVENKGYIFACHPHGRMFYSAIIFSQLHETWRRSILKSGDLFMGAAGGFFYVPILNFFFSLVGTINVTPSEIQAKLRQKNHVSILVGGVKEVLLGTDDHVDRIYLRRRYSNSRGLLPVFSFIRYSRTTAHDGSK